mgnify:FL=1
MKAVIMAGGKGTRLRPLTCCLPKPMVPIANQPMMTHIIKLVKQHGFTNVTATLFYLPDAIRNYFGDGRDFGLELNYAIEDVPLGTAGSVKNACGAALKDTLLVISGDTLTDINLAEALEFHRSKGSAATLVLTKVRSPLEYGLVITDTGGRIRRFLEKPGWGEVFSDCVNTGIYILEPEVLKEIPDGQVFDFSKNLFPALLKKKAPLYGFLAKGYWSDIGNLDQYREAQIDILRGNIQVAGTQAAPYQPGVWVGEGSEISADAILAGPALIGSGCIVSAGAFVGEFSMIGDDVRIESGSSIKRSVIWSGSRIGAGSELRGVVATSRTTIGPQVAAFEGVVIGERSYVGERAIIRPGVKIWPDKQIEAGAIINDSVIWSAGTGKSLFGRLGISGTANMAISPEFGAKVAAAYASLLPRSSSAVVSADGYRVSRMLKRAVMAGFLSAGINVYDLGSLTTPVARYAIRALNAAAGLQIRLSPYYHDQVLLEFLDQEGLNINRATERSVENAYFCEDFPRAAVEDIGEVVFVPRLIEGYMDGLLRSTAVDQIAARGYKIVVTYDAGHLSMLLPGLFARLNCEIVTIPHREHGPRPKSLDQILAALDDLAGLVRSHGADLGIVVDNNAERLILIDEQGRLVQDEQMLALVSLIILKQGNPQALPIPVTASRVIDQMADEYHRSVIRTQTSPRSQMERLAEQKIFDDSGGSGGPSFQPTFDALISLAKILEVMTRDSLTLGQLVDMIPPIHMSKQTADCPWQSKGLVMRSLIEEHSNDAVEMIDGLKVFHDNDWVLVLPDSDQPVFQVYSEASSQEEADALAELYLGRIERLQTQLS